MPYVRRKALDMSTGLETSPLTFSEERRRKMFTPATTRPCGFFIGNPPKNEFEQTTCERPNCGATYAQHNGQSQKRR